MSAFDKIGKTAPKTASKKTDIRTASVTDDLRANVDKLIESKAAISTLEATVADCEGKIIDEVRPQQDQLALNGDFTKSLEVPGSKGSVLYNTADRFSVPQEDDAQEAIKKLVGPEKYAEFFEEKTTFSLKDSVAKNEELLTKISKACEKAGMDIGDLFDRVVKTVSRDGLDRKQYELGAKKLAEFRTLVRQSKPSVRDRGK